ncbi:hypothetical protein LguiA_008626 [Lonicera macranthoides]
MKISVMLLQLKQCWQLKSASSLWAISVSIEKIILPKLLKMLLYLLKEMLLINDICCILGLYQLPPIGAKCSVTRWLSPKEGWVKLNSDGCSKGNPGLSGGGSVPTWLLKPAERFLMEPKDGKVELQSGSLVLVHILEKRNDIPVENKLDATSFQVGSWDINDKRN